MLFWHCIPLGVDFTGGTKVYVSFADAPNDKEIRDVLNHAGLQRAIVQRLTGGEAPNQLVITLDQKDTAESDLSRGKNQIIGALEANAPPGKQNLNNNDRIGVAAIRDKLIERDPLHAGPEEYERIARQVVEARNQSPGGVLKNLDDLKSVVPSPVVESLKQDFFTSNFAVRRADIVGPQVGDQLKRQAKLAVGFSLVGMLVYLWFRFELIYGVAAVVAVFHDT